MIPRSLKCDIRWSTDQPRPELLVGANGNDLDEYGFPGGLTRGEGAAASPQRTHEVRARARSQLLHRSLRLPRSARPGQTPTNLPPRQRPVHVRCSLFTVSVFVEHRPALQQRGEPRRRVGGAMSMATICSQPGVGDPEAPAFALVDDQAVPLQSSDSSTSASVLSGSSCQTRQGAFGRQSQRRGVGRRVPSSPA